MADMAKQSANKQLLFFDTFTYDINSKELRLDLVQFPQPVTIDEVRVIPLGARAFVTNKAGGERLGATNPSSFHLDMFVNNIAKLNSATFLHLGSLDFKHNSSIQFSANKKIATDGLVLRGWYSALTVAVYGSLTSLPKGDDSPPPPPPPAARNKPQAAELHPTEREVPREPLKPHPLDYIQSRIDEAEAHAKVIASTAARQPEQPDKPRASSQERGRPEQRSDDTRSDSRPDSRPPSFERPGGDGRQSFERSTGDRQGFDRRDERRDDRRDERRDADRPGSDSEFSRRDARDTDKGFDRRDRDDKRPDSHFERRENDRDSSHYERRESDREDSRYDRRDDRDDSHYERRDDSDRDDSDYDRRDDDSNDSRHDRREGDKRDSRYDRRDDREDSYERRDSDKPDSHFGRRDDRPDSHYDRRDSDKPTNLEKIDDDSRSLPSPRNDERESSPVDRSADASPFDRDSEGRAPSYDKEPDPRSMIEKEDANVRSSSYERGGGDPRSSSYERNTDHARASSYERNTDSTHPPRTSSYERSVDPRSSSRERNTDPSHPRTSSYERNVDTRSSDRGGQDPRSSDRGGPDPRSSDRGGPDPRSSDRGGPDPRSSDRGGPDPRSSDRGGPDSRSSDRGGPDPRSSDRSVPDPRSSDRGGPDPRSSERIAPDPRSSERGGQDPRSSDRSGPRRSSSYERNTGDFRSPTYERGGQRIDRGDIDQQQNVPFELISPSRQFDRGSADRRHDSRSSSYERGERARDGRSASFERGGDPEPRSSSYERGGAPEVISPSYALPPPENRPPSQEGVDPDVRMDQDFGPEEGSPQQFDRRGGDGIPDQFQLRPDDQIPGFNDRGGPPVSLGPTEIQIPGFETSGPGSDLRSPRGQFERGGQPPRPFDHPQRDEEMRPFDRGGPDMRPDHPDMRPDHPDMRPDLPDMGPDHFNRGGPDARPFDDDSRDSYEQDYYDDRRSPNNRFFPRGPPDRRDNFFDPFVDNRDDPRDRRPGEFRRSGDFHDNRMEPEFDPNVSQAPNFPDPRHNAPDFRGGFRGHRGNFPERKGRFPGPRGRFPRPRGNFHDQRPNFPHRGGFSDHRGNFPDPHGNFPPPPDDRSVPDRSVPDRGVPGIDTTPGKKTLLPNPVPIPNPPEQADAFPGGPDTSPDGDHLSRDNVPPNAQKPWTDWNRNAPPGQPQPPITGEDQPTAHVSPQSPGGHSQSPSRHSQSPDWTVKDTDRPSPSAEQTASRSQSPTEKPQHPEERVRSRSPNDIRSPNWQQSRGYGGGQGYNEGYGQRGYGSDGDIQEGPVDYEAISSDDDMGIQEEAADMEYYDETLALPPTTFNTFQVDLAPLDTFADPSLTQYEILTHKWLGMCATELTDPPANSGTLLQVMEVFTNADHNTRWVEAVETIPPLLYDGLSFLRAKDPNSDILETLLMWAMEGVDLEKAIQQPETAFKVRHIKMGVRLCGELCACEPDITIRLLQQDIQHKLLDLYVSPAMSIPVKLLIIRALDQTTRFKEGIDWFLGQHSSQSKEAKLISPYQRVIEILLTKQQVRAVAMMSALIRKVHTYEVLNKLAQATEYVVENMTTGDDDMTDKGDNCSPDEEMDVGGATRLSEGYADTLILCLREIHKVLVCAPQIVSLPKNSLPLTSVFERQAPYTDPYPNLYHMFNSCRLLECLFILVTSTLTHPTVFHTIRDVFRQLMRMHGGLLFLSSRPETTNGIIRSLTQSIEYNHEDGDEAPSQQLGLDLIFHLHTLQFVDQLNLFHKKVSTDDYDGHECLPILRSLYMISFSPTGRRALVSVLGFADNILPLVDFVKETGEAESDAQISQSNCTNYAADLLLCVLRYGDNLEFLQRHSVALLALSKQESYPKLAELAEWLNVTSSFTGYTYTSLDSIITQLKSFTDELTKLPKGLVTTLRVIKALCIEPEHLITDDSERELKYKYAISHIYSADCLALFYKILQGICDMMMYPWKQGLLSSCGHLTTYIHIIKPCIALVKAITAALIEAKGATFKDVTALHTLFDVHSVLCTLPASNSYLADINIIQKDLIDTIASYTKPIVITSESEEALTQSLWCQTLKELFKYILKAPYCYVSGLMILSELLPLPLPIQTREALLPADADMAITGRKLWSAHLHPVTSHIQTIISTLSGSTCHAQQQILRRVCWQLTDLSCQMATVIVKFLVDTILTTLTELSPPPTTPDEPQKDTIASTQLCQLLDLLAFNLTQPVFKASVLALTRTGSGAEERYTQLWPRLMCLLNSVPDKECKPHGRAQECLASILQTLCDPDISLVSQDADIPINEQLANALPNPEMMTLVTSAMVEHIGNPDQNYSSVLPCLRTMVMCTDHNYGFFHLKAAFDKQSQSLHHLLVRINNTFSKDSSDCLSSLSTVLELLRLLGMSQPVDEDQPITRDLKLTGRQLREVMLWKSDQEGHPLDDLEKLLEACSQDEENLQSLFESIVVVTQIIRAVEEDETQEIQDPEPPEISEPTPLASQFAQRSIYAIADQDDDRLTYHCWKI